VNGGVTAKFLRPFAYARRLRNATAIGKLASEIGRSMLAPIAATDQ